MADDAVVEVRSGDAPLNRYLQCPWLALCDEVRVALGSRRCTETSRSVFNPSPGSECGATVQVNPATWSQVTALYRD